MLEEECLISPKRCRDAARRDHPTDELSTRLGHLVNWVMVGEHLEQDCAGGDSGELVLEVSLPGVGPAIDVEGLELEDEWPLGIGLDVPCLADLTPVLNAHGTNMICCLCQLFSNRLASAHIKRLVQMS